MHRTVLILAAGLAVLGSPSGGSSAADPPKPSGTERPYGIEHRVLWTTSKVKGSPDPPSPYRTERVFPKLAFKLPLALECPPGSDRLFVVQRYGKIYSFLNDPQAERSELLIDIGKEV